MAADLTEEAARMGIIIDADKLNAFLTYYSELMIWNRRINIISENSVREIVKKHFVDSLIPLRYLNRPGGFLIDLGSGGGFPGIPLKIMLPELKVYLADSSRKKTSFLAHVASTLKLTETFVMRGRIEDLAATEDLAGKFDTVVSRAAFKLDSLLLFSSCFLKHGGQLIAMKGSELPLEIRAAETVAGDAGMMLAPESPQDSSVNYSVRKIIIYNRI